ncbi:MAG TPA: toll/interleukin-1 receptor domain-containing protein [Verrucomicrobiae bacterium]|nr:toll/interleukin-1 receptor domain-containing protein [Verrucomicrobiae bacterium]
MPDGTYCCRGFEGAGFATPALVVVLAVGQGTQAAQTAERELVAAVISLSGQPEHLGMPCRGSIATPLRCHAHEVRSCHKLLVVIGDQHTPIAYSGIIAEWDTKRRSDDSYQILPVFPLGSQVDQLLPLELRGLNACFYQDVKQHIIPCVLARSGITSEDYRVFISYKRDETSALADQLFGVLSAAGFDVFLDRYCLPAGVSFQEYLAQELADKSMLLVLESDGVVTSDWVKWEIDLAKKSKMGLIALHPAGAAMHPDIDPPRRRELNAAAPQDPRRIADALAQQVVLWVREVHNAALHKRRNELRQNLIGEAGIWGLSVDSSAPQGYVKLQSASVPRREYRIWLTSRLLQFDDFHYTDTECVANSSGTGLVMSSMPHVVKLRREKIEWLARCSGIRFSDEGQLIHTVAKIAGGTL